MRLTSTVLTAGILLIPFAGFSRTATMPSGDGVSGSGAMSDVPAAPEDQRSILMKAAFAQIEQVQSIQCDQIPVNNQVNPMQQLILTLRTCLEKKPQIAGSENGYKAAENFFTLFNRIDWASPLDLEAQNICSGAFIDDKLVDMRAKRSQNVAAKAANDEIKRILGFGVPGLKSASLACPELLIRAKGRDLIQGAARTNP